MDILGLVMVFLGILAFCMGMYELVKKKVVGRNVSASTPEQIERFSKIDGFTYLVEGIDVILLAYSEQLPFMRPPAAKTAALVILVGAIVFNSVMAKKILNTFPKDG